MDDMITFADLPRPAPKPAPLRTDADWPTDRDTVRFLVRTKPNRDGLQDFYALWWLGGSRQARFFHAKLLDEQKRAARRESVTIEVIERFGPLSRVAA